MSVVPPPSGRFEDQRVRYQGMLANYRTEKDEQIEENDRRQDEQDKRERQEALMRALKDEEARRQAEESKAAIPKPDDNSSAITLAPSSAASSIRSGRSPARGPARHFV